MGGQYSKINDPEFAKSVAELEAAGVSRSEMAETFDCTKRTIGTWVKDPRVQLHTRRISLERVTKIVRKVDGEIEARLAHIEDWETDMILKVRKEYLDRPLKAAAGEDIDASKVVNELSEAMDQSPDFAQQLRDLMDNRGTKEPVVAKE